MANVMGIWGGLVGPKSGNVEKVLVFKAFLKGSRKPRGPQGKFATERAGPVGGGRGRETLPLGVCLRFWRFGGFVA